MRTSVHSDTAGHSVKITPDAAAAVRRFAADAQLDATRLCLIVLRKPIGELGLDLSDDDARYCRHPDNAVATSYGIRVVIPRVHVRLFHDLIVDYWMGNFVFRGSAAPPIALASEPGLVTLSGELLAELAPQAYGNPDVAMRLAHHLWNGDSRAAVVMAVRPQLVVAAFTDELDAVALLAFPERVAIRRGVDLADRLLTVNTYEVDERTAPDLVRGPGDCGQYGNFIPLIADFLADNPERAAARKSEIAESEWQRAALLGRAAMARASGRYRDGTPTQTGRPAA